MALLEAGDGRPMRQSFAAAVAGVPVAADAHQHLDPLGHEHHFDALRRQRRIAHQVLRVEADRIAEAVVAGTGKAEAAAAKIGVGLVEANLLPVTGAELGGGRAEPAGGDGELVLDDAEQGVCVVDHVGLVGERILVSYPEIAGLAGALSNISQIVAAESHVATP